MKILFLRLTYHKVRILRELKRIFHDITPPILIRIIAGKRYTSGRHKIGTEAEEQYADRIKMDHVDLSFIDWFLRIAIAGVFIYHGIDKFPKLEGMAEMMGMPVFMILLMILLYVLVKGERA